MKVYLLIFDGSAFLNLRFSKQNHYFKSKSNFITNIQMSIFKHKFNNKCGALVNSSEHFLEHMRRILR